MCTVCDELRASLESTLKLRIPFSALRIGIARGDSNLTARYSRDLAAAIQDAGGPDIPAADVTEALGIMNAHQPLPVAAYTEDEED